MEQQFYGYMRVSSVEQNVERQRQELVRWGIVEKHIYTDKVSGKDFNRPSYQNMRKKLKKEGTGNDGRRKNYFL